MACYIDELIHHIDHELLQIDRCEDISVNGIQVEGSRKKIQKIGTGVTASLSVIERACKEGIDLLIVHHGLLVKNRTRALRGVFLKKIELLYSYGITLLGYHLPLDIHPVLGNAYSLPLDLGWKNLSPFCNFGVKADLPSKMSANALCETLLTPYFEPVRYSLLMPEKIVETVAFLPGHGHKYIEAAIEEQIDFFITGTADEPLWHIAREENIAFCSFGHHATEKKGVQKLGEYLSQKYSILHTFYDELNPF